MSNQANKIQKQLDAFNAVQRTILQKIGDEAKKFFVEGFEKQGFTDVNFEAWEKDRDSKQGKILEATGDLKRSIKVSNITEDSVTVSSDLPYSQYVNDGTRRSPAREFIGKSNVLETETKNTIDKEIKKIF